MTIDAQQIKDSFKRFDVVAITKDDNSYIYLWSTEPTYKDRIYGWNSDDDCYLCHCLGKLEITEFQGKDTKDCIIVFEKPIDYSKWIGKLCWFWDDEENTHNMKMGTLLSTSMHGKYRWFNMNNNTSWINCRPVRRDEVQFVEE